MLKLEHSISVSLKKTTKQTRSIKLRIMDVKFKTLDKQRFTMNVDPHEQVEDLIFRLENRLGRENLYRLIYAGKLLKEGTPVSNYNISPKLPVIIMITQPLQQKVDNESIEQMEMIRRNNITEIKDDKVRDNQLTTENEDSGYDSDEDMPTNFVRENKFSVALDVVMTCKNLVDRKKTPLTKDEMVSYINTELNKEDDVESNLRDQILEKIDPLFKRIPKKKQISAFLVDIQRVLNETCDISNNIGGKIGDIDIEHEQSYEMAEREVKNIETEEKEKIKSSFNLKWVNQITSKVSTLQANPLYHFPAKSKSLSFLQDNGEFQFPSSNHYY